MEHINSEPPGFFTRLALAFKVLMDPLFAAKISAPQPVSVPPAPEKPAVSPLFLLSALQREGRLVDFLKQEIATFSDEEIGSAARVVHAGCRKALDQYLVCQPLLQAAEASRVTLPANFNPQEYRLEGNLTGKPPFQGTLKHHGWKVTEINLPTFTKGIDDRILAPAEVEI
ncbi:MAG: DUF2760 domain-containing protein [Verrucomicrobiota bacterium]|nr:DUF2760 domain-containing protein [Verrucomicrobiota bacterium]